MCNREWPSNWPGPGSIQCCLQRGITYILPIYVSLGRARWSVLSVSRGVRNPRQTQPMIAAGTTTPHKQIVWMTPFVSRQHTMNTDTHLSPAEHWTIICIHNKLGVNFMIFNNTIVYSHIKNNTFIVISFLVLFFLVILSQVRLHSQSISTKWHMERQVWFRVGKVMGRLRGRRIGVRHQNNSTMQGAPLSLRFSDALRSTQLTLEAEIN